MDVARIINKGDKIYTHNPYKYFKFENTPAAMFDILLFRRYLKNTN